MEGYVASSSIIMFPALFVRLFYGRYYTLIEILCKLGMGKGVKGIMEMESEKVENRLEGLVLLGFNGLRLY